MRVAMYRKGNVEFFFVVGKPVEKLDVLPSHRGLRVLCVSKCINLRKKESVQVRGVIGVVALEC